MGEGEGEGRGDEEGGGIMVTGWGRELLPIISTVEYKLVNEMTVPLDGSLIICRIESTQCVDTIL